MTEAPAYLETGAGFSDCRVYRYTLWRIWDPGLPRLAFIGLNPSTATETVDDPTMRRCRGFAAREGYGGFDMLNIFGYRATDPAEMKRQDEPVGPGNDAAIRDVSRRTGVVVACWGTHGGHLGRDSDVCAILADEGVSVLCLGTTKQGFPRHPLYVKGDQPMVEFPVDLGSRH
ncbi:MAG: DUF1643 domain-containing protein [Planctomycetota bacterium]